MTVFQKIASITMSYAWAENGGLEILFPWCYSGKGYYP